MANNRFYIGNDLHEMEPAKASSATVRTIFKAEDGILLCYGKTMPVDASAGYATGCLFMHTDGANGSALYVNEGTVLSSDFNLITVA